MNENKLPIALFNGTIVTTNGLYRVTDIDTDKAIKLVQDYGFVSAIGHTATANILSDIFDQDIPMRRIRFAQEVSQLAIAFKLKIRPDEGAVLTIEELKSIGYELKLMERIE